MTENIPIRPYNEQVAILRKININDDDADEELQNIKKTIDLLLGEDDIQPEKIKNQLTRNEVNLEQFSVSNLETKLSRELEQLKVKANLLEEKVEEKKNQIAQSKLENKKKEAIFIVSLRSIRDQICKKAEVLKSNS